MYLKETYTTNMKTAKHSLNKNNNFRVQIYLYKDIRIKNPFFIDAEHIRANRDNKLILRIWIIKKYILSAVVDQYVKTNSREDKYMSYIIQKSAPT